jgi:hypothetical protein
MTANVNVNICSTSFSDWVHNNTTIAFKCFHILSHCILSQSDGRRGRCGIRPFALRCVYVSVYFGKFGPWGPKLGPTMSPSWDRNYIEYGDRFICVRLLRYDVASQHMNVCSVQCCSCNHIGDFSNSKIQHITFMRVRHSMFLDLRIRNCVLLDYRVGLATVATYSFLGVGL